MTRWPWQDWRCSSAPQFHSSLGLSIVAWFHGAGRRCHLGSLRSMTSQSRCLIMFYRLTVSYIVSYCWCCCCRSCSTAVARCYKIYKRMSKHGENMWKHGFDSRCLEILERGRHARAGKAAAAFQTLSRSGTSGPLSTDLRAKCIQSTAKKVEVVGSIESYYNWYNLTLLAWKSYVYWCLLHVYVRSKIAIWQKLTNNKHWENLGSSAIAS